jgi:L-alanine-DL-glutamate epimerase-like enolase superfamily enzyme
MLVEVVEGRDAFAVTRSWQAMAKALRNAGRPGVGSEAMAAVDTSNTILESRASSRA